MPKRKTHEEFIDEINSKYSQINILSQYVNSVTKIDCYCTKHDYTWSVKPQVLLSSKSGCPKCAIETRSKNRTKTHIQFQEELLKVNNKIQLLSEYKKSSDYIKCKCIIDGHEWLSVASSLLQGNGCPKCGIEKVQSTRRIDKNKFISKLHKVNPDVDLVSNYVDMHTTITVKCKICDYVWTTQPNGIMYKRTKCPQCIGVIITPSHYKKIVYEMVGEEYTVLSNYIDYKTKIKYKHNACGTIFSLSPSNFKKRKVKCSNKECRHSAYIFDDMDVDNRLINTDYMLKSKYNGVDSPGIFMCKKCNTIFRLNRTGKIFESVSHTHCPKCLSENILLNNEKDYISNFHETYGSEFEVVSKYNGCDKPIKILHKNCNCISEYNRAGKLLTEYVVPCKKCNITNGEKVIMDYLNHESVSHLNQHRFDDLRGVNNGLLSYDFYIPQYNLLIEFQGKQHEKPIEYFGGKAQFDIQQEHDKRKRKYAKSHGIKLLEIWYWDFENIEKILRKELGIAA